MKWINPIHGIKVVHNLQFLLIIAYKVIRSKVNFIVGNFNQIVS